jgi:hypothetical protein
VSFRTAEVSVVVHDWPQALVKVRQAGAVPCAVDALTGSVEFIALDVHVPAGALVIARGQTATPYPRVASWTAATTQIPVVIDDLSALAIAEVNRGIVPTSVDFLAARIEPIAVDGNILACLPVTAMRQTSLRRRQTCPSQQNEADCERGVQSHTVHADSPSCQEDLFQIVLVRAGLDSAARSGVVAGKRIEN